MLRITETLRGCLSLLVLAAGGLAACGVGNAAVSHATQPASGEGNAQRLSELVDQARADLAQRLTVDPGKIAVIEARHVVWPDSSAGCPSPGYKYMQMLLRGILIRLQVGDRIYHYHAGTRGPAAFCETPAADSPPSLYEER